jgi:hypothetical protein
MATHNRTATHSRTVSVRKEKTKPRTPGRPSNEGARADGSPNVGSPDKQRVVWQLPTHCTRCGSDKLPPIAGAQPLTREIAGELQGVQHTSVRWQHCACADCGQVLVVRSGLA